MLAIAGFLTSLWLSSKISRRIGVSSIVMEVAVGLVLGPQVAGLIPSELSECYADQTVKCDEREYQMKIAEKGYKWCDLGEYLKEGKYTRGAWNTGFFGNGHGNNNGMVVFSGDKGGTYNLDRSRRLLENRSSRLLEASVTNDVAEIFEGSSRKLLTSRDRRLAGDAKGKTKYDTYDECLKKSCERDVNDECAYYPDIFTLVGHTGVAMMIFESGLHFDFEQAKTVGPWACAVAVLGTFLPLLTGAGLAKAYGFDLFPDCMSAGTALAPTSVGIALKLLHEARALQTYFGQAVMTAAFVDDVLSLILFSVIFQIGDDMDFFTFVPLILGCVFMVVAIVGAVVFWPPFIKKLFEYCPEYKPSAKVTTHDEAMWFLMFVTLCAYAQITHMCGTHLWGCFIAGMSFATQHHAHHVWVKQVKRITCWFLRIFFGCTLAWSIPVKELFSIDAFWKGSIMGIGPCIATKVLCGPFMGSARWVIGWAMVGRAEFAYFIAILAQSTGKMEKKLFAILVWALLYATIFAPLIFRKVLARYMLTQAGGETDDAPMGHQLSHRNSGHLPDFEEEKEMEEHEKMMKENKEWTEEVNQKEIQIEELEQELNALQEELQKARKIPEEPTEDFTL